MLRLLCSLTLILVLVLSGLMVVVRWVGERAETQLIAYAKLPRGIGAVDVQHHLEGLLIADPTINPNVGMAWSPDGSTLAYAASHPEDSTTQLYLFDLETRTRRNLSNKPFDAVWPSWSPDGAMLAFTSFPRITNEAGETLSVNTAIYVMDVETGEDVDALTQPPTVARFTPAWSPDGRWLAVSAQISVDPALGQVQVLDVDTGEAVRLIDPNTSGASWSPDSRWLLFSIQSAERSALGVADMETGTVRQLVERIYSFPMVSPDSGSVAYTSLEPGLGGAREMLHLVDIESGERQTLTDHAYSDSHPVWSPDGRWLLVDSSRSGFEQLFLMDTATGAWRALTNMSYFPNQLPVWSPDSQWIAFSSSISGRAEIYVVSVPDGVVSQMTNYDANFAPIWQP